MAIRKVILKQSHVEAVVKVVADAAGSVTISLATDLLKSNETISQSITPKVAISALEWAQTDNTGKITITRNSLPIYVLQSSTQLSNAFTADHDQSDTDITVTFTDTGTLIMRLIKLEGYEANYRPEQGVA